MNNNTTNTSMSCIFCKIIQKDIPAHVVHESDFTLSFLDIHPCTKGHAVVIPKAHVLSIEDADEHVLSTLLFGVQETVAILRKVLSPDAFSIGWNNGKEAGQAVPHLHMHILPRWKGDGGGSMHSIVQKDSDSTIEELALLF